VAVVVHRLAAMAVAQEGREGSLAALVARAGGWEAQAVMAAVQWSTPICYRRRTGYWWEAVGTAQTRDQNV